MKKNTVIKFDAVCLAVVITVAIFSRVIVSFLSTNYLDILQYYLWAMGLQDGLWTAYINMPGLDYPPLTLPFYYFGGWLVTNFSIAGNHPFLVLKILTIVVDTLACILIYTIIKKRVTNEGGKKWLPTVVALVYALNPSLLINTAWWGQTDGLIMFFCLAVCVLIEKKRFNWAAAVCALAMLTKIQGAFLVLILGLELLRNDGDGFNFTRTVKRTLLATVTYMAVFFAGLAPFIPHHGIWGIFSRIYINAAEMRPIASLRAFNFLAFLGGSNVPHDVEPFGGGVSFFMIGIFCIVCAAIAFSVFYLTRKKPDVFLGFGMILYTIFMFMPQMHERYMIYIIPLFLVAAVLSRDFSVHLKIILTIATLVIFINHAILMWGMLNQPTRELWIDGFERFVWVMSAVNVVLYVATCIVYVKKEWKSPDV
jgi:Gpi18-like mannosyltransferase